MTLKGGRLNFTTTSGKTLFDTPLGNVLDITSPRLSMGELLHFTIDGRRYQATFGKEAFTTAEKIGGYGERRELCQQWEQYLLGTAPAEDAFEHHPRPYGDA